MDDYELKKSFKIFKSLHITEQWFPTFFDALFHSSLCSFWNFSFLPYSRPVASVESLWGQNTFLPEKDYCFNFMIKLVILCK